MSNHRWDKEQWILILDVQNDSKFFYNELSKHSENICQLDVRYVFINPGNIFNFLLHHDQPNSLEQETVSWNRKLNSASQLGGQLKELRISK